MNQHPSRLRSVHQRLPLSEKLSELILLRKVKLISEHDTSRRQASGSPDDSVASRYL